MANLGKFTDHSPLICPAGKQSAEHKSVVECLQEYRIEDAVNAVKHEAGIYTDKEKIPYKPQRISNFRNLGIFDEAKECLHPPVKTRYQTLINDLKETTYKSFWEKEEGRTKDPISGLPTGMISSNVTFGRPTNRVVTMKDLINPPKTVYEVLWDSQIAHDMYKKTHNDYNPSERIDRGYLKPPFEPNRTYGAKTKYDPRGILVRCLCKWHLNDPVYTLSKGQADFVEKARYKLGKVLEPIKNIESVPKGHTFGKKLNRPLFGMKELLRDSDIKPCIFKRDFDEWISHLNYIRQYIKRRRIFNLNLSEVTDMILYYDKNDDGWVSLDILYKILKCVKIYCNEKVMNSLLDFLGYTDQRCVFYRAVLDLFDVNKPLPDIKKIKDIPELNLYYITTNMAAQCDYIIIDHTNMPTAGMPTKSTLAHPRKPEGGCKADINSLGAETLAGQIIYPSIYTSYGLSHRDFFKPRNAVVLRKLFENVGYQFTDDTFEGLWKIGIERDKTGLVCVDTFYNILQESVPPPVLITNEKKCP